MARRRLPPLKALPAFEEAARQLSFSAAARTLNLTHGAISRQMKLLESHLGVRLFRRLSRRLELTEAGASLLPAVRTALDVVEDSAARLSAASRAGSAEGPLVVACLPTFMMRWLIPRLYDFAARHPSVEVRLSASSGPVDFAREGIDLAIRVGTPPWPEGIVAHAFMDEEIGPVCSPGLLKKGRLDLARHPRLHTETRPDAWSDWWTRSARKPTEAPKERRFEHFYFLLEAAAAGLGVAMAPRPLVREDLKLGRLVAPFGFVQSGRQYCLLHPAELAGAAKLRIFRSWLEGVRR